MSQDASQPPGATPKRRPGFWQRLLGRAPAQEAPTTTATVDEPAAAPIGMASVPTPGGGDTARMALLHELASLRQSRRTDEAIFKIEQLLQADSPPGGAATPATDLQFRADLHGELHACYKRAGDPYATLAHGHRWVSALVKAGHQRDGLQALRELHNIDEDFKLDDPAAAVPLAKLALQDGDSELAVGLVDGFDRRFPGHPDMPLMYFLGARLLSEHWRKHEKAAQMLRSIIGHFGEHEVAAEAKAYLVALDALIEPGKA